MILAKIFSRFPLLSIFYITARINYSLHSQLWLAMIRFYYHSLNSNSFPKVIRLAWASKDKNINFTKDTKFFALSKTCLQFRFHDNGIGYQWASVKDIIIFSGNEQLAVHRIILCRWHSFKIITDLLGDAITNLRLYLPIHVFLRRTNKREKNHTMKNY